MKKICLLMCCVLILQMLCACGRKNEEFQVPVNFYYCNKEVSYNSPAGVIQAEKREGIGFHGDAAALLRAYLLGPVSSDLLSLIPSDTQLRFCEVDGDTINVALSAQFSKLSGVRLTTACSALLMTLHDYTGAQTLCVCAEDSQLDEKDEFVLTMDDIVLMDMVTIEE